MNSFRDGINGRVAPGPTMPVKQSRLQPRLDNVLAGLTVPRAESRTHNHRAEDRKPLSAEEARLFVNRKSYVVDLLNLSGGGAMIKTNLPLKLWKRVHLELGDNDTVECAVRWIKGDRIGLEFAHETQVVGDAAKRDAMLIEAIERNFSDLGETPQDAGEKPASDSQPNGQRRCELRHPLIWWGHIHHDHESTRVRLRNISEHGAMIDCTRTIVEGTEILLDLGEAEQHFAIVSWIRGDQLGLRFQRPFDIACLARAEIEVAPQSWTRPAYLNAGQDTDSPWAAPWERLSLRELRSTLDGFLKS